MPPAAELQWEPSVRSYLEQCVGPSKVEQWSRALAAPSLSVCLRVNTTRTSTEDVLQKLRHRGYEATVAPQGLPAVLLQGSGPHPLDLSAVEGEVICSWRAAEAVLKGAHLYAPGVVAASEKLRPGALVAVTLASPGEDLPRGTVLGAPWGAESRAQRCVGVGRLRQELRAVFGAEAAGVAVELEKRLFNLPPCNGLLPGEVALQALPSLLAAHVLAPPRGSLVLDMCAAPGGKATALAELMGDTGRVWALDRSHTKVAHIAALARELGLTSVSAHKLDATRACVESCGDSPLLSEPDQPGSAGKGQQKEEREESLSQKEDWPAVWEEEEGQPAEASNPKVARREAAREATMRAAGLAYTPAARHRRSAAGRVLKGFRPASFPFILLDAPCSALGLRPRLAQTATLQDLRHLAHHQRRLLEAAVQLLAPGGALVFSTCTLNPGENEANVRRLLDAHPELELVPQHPRLGRPGIEDSSAQGLPAEETYWVDGVERTRERDRFLTAEEAALVQRIDPASKLDTQGFFIAKFRKRGA